MNLILEIINTVSHNTMPNSIRFTKEGGTLGRSKHSTWKLNDPEKNISNLHAQITYTNGQYFITDKSTNGTFWEKPYKRLAKNTPTPLKTNSVIIIGDYHIKAKTLHDSIEEDLLNLSAGSIPSVPLADDFFLDNQHAETLDIIKDKSPHKDDILSLIQNDASPTPSENSQFLPDLDQILGSAVFNTPLTNHVDSLSFDTKYQEEKSVSKIPDFSSIQEKQSVPKETKIPEEEILPEVESKPTNVDTQKVPSQTSTQTIENPSQAKLLQLFSLKFGINLEAMKSEEQEKFIGQIIDLAQVGLEQTLQADQSLHKIKKSLKLPIHEASDNPLSTAKSSKELIANMQHYPQPLSHYLKHSFYTLKIHNLAFNEAFKSIYFKMSQKFAPQNLYYSFEKEGLLDKSFSNKKALAWEAYSKQFQTLDNIKEEEPNVEELQKEYHKAFDMFSLGHNK